MAHNPNGYAVYWDNGAHASGVFSERFATEEEAQAFADDWVRDMTAISEADGYYDGEGYSAEVITAEEADAKPEEN
jgi:hypothetical protein